MRKDYISVLGEDQRGEEADFVQRYWTKIWEEGAGEGSWNRDIAQREEFVLMKPYLDKLPRGARILDGGCGTGAWVLHLASLGFDVVGVDISEATVAKLKALFPDKCFQAGDIRATPFADNSFDAYFSWGTFEHFELGLGACFKEARRILKPGGFLFVSVPFHNERLWRRDKKALSVTDADYEPGKGYLQAQRFYQWRLTKQELRREFEMHDFNTLQLNTIHKSAGVHRMIVTDLGFSSDSTAHFLLSKVLSLFLTKNRVSHMIMAIGQKKLP